MQTNLQQTINFEEFKYVINEAINNDIYKKLNDQKKCKYLMALIGKKFNINDKNLIIEYLQELKYYDIIDLLNGIKNSINILVIACNNNELTHACIQSINKSTPNARIFLIDNGYDLLDCHEQIKIHNYPKNVIFIDNFNRQLFDIDTEYEFHIDYGDALHTYAIQWFMDNYNIPFTLVESDVIIKKDLHDFVYNKDLYVIGFFDKEIKFDDYIYNIVVTRRERVVPYLCYFNTPKLKQCGIKYFDKSRIAIDNDMNYNYNTYTTGSSFYEDIISTIDQNLYDICDEHVPNYEYNIQTNNANRTDKFNTFANHLGGGSWKEALNDHYVPKDFSHLDWNNEITQEEAINKGYIKFNFDEYCKYWIELHKKYWYSPRFGMAIIFNDAYLPGALVFLNTFFKFNPWYDGDIICMVDDKYCTLSQENRNYIQSKFKNVYFHQVDSSKYDKFVEHFYDIMFYKRFIVSAFTLESFALKYDQNGNEYDRIVYLDVDQIVEGDISLLFNTDKDIVAAPGDCEIINDISDTLYKRTNESISGGLFSIDKKYLGIEIRDEIIKCGETFEFYKYEKWDGSGFEMHVLNLWLLDKDTWITPTTYAYPSPMIAQRNELYIEKLPEKSGFIFDGLLKYSKIIHIWNDKPWMSDNNKTSNMINSYWSQLYDSILNNTQPQTLSQFFNNDDFLKNVEIYNKCYINDEYKMLKYYF